MKKKKHDGSLTAIRAPKLQNVGGSLKFERNSQLDSVLLTELKACGTDLSIGIEVDDLADSTANRGNITELILDSLVTVGRDFDIENLGRVAVLNMPELSRVGGDFDVDFDLGLIQLLVPALVAVGGDLDVHDLPSLEQLTISALDTVGDDLELKRLGKLTAILLPALTNVTDEIYIDGNPALLNISAPELIFCGDNFFVGTDVNSLSDAIVTPGRLMHLDLDKLAVVVADFCVENLGILMLSLPSLVSVGGYFDVDYDPGLEKIWAPILSEVGGELEVHDLPSLKWLNMRALKAVGGYLEVHDLPSLEELNLSSIETVGQDLQLYELGILEELRFPVLVGIDGYCELSSIKYLALIEVPKLAKVGGSFTVDKIDRLGELKLPALVGIGSSFQVNSMVFLGSIVAPVLANVSGEIEVRDCQGLLTLSLPALKTAGFVDVSINQMLNSFSAPQLTAVGGHLWIYDNIGMTSIMMGALMTVGGELWIGPEDLAIENLVVLDMASLERVSKNFEFTAAQSVPSIDFPELKEVATRLLIGKLGKAQSVNLPKLTALGALTIRESPKLKTISAPELVSIGSTCPFFDTSQYCSGWLFIGYTPALSTIDFGALNKTLGYLELDSTGLVTVEFPGLKAIGGAHLVTKNPKLRSMTYPHLKSVGDGPGQPGSRARGISAGALPVQWTANPSLINVCVANHVADVWAVTVEQLAGTGQFVLTSCSLTTVTTTMTTPSPLSMSSSTPPSASPSTPPSLSPSTPPSTSPPSSPPGRSPPNLVLPTGCDLAPTTQRDCGIDITEEACLERGCCWITSPDQDPTGSGSRITTEGELEAPVSRCHYPARSTFTSLSRTAVNQPTATLIAGTRPQKGAGSPASTTLQPGGDDASAQDSSSDSRSMLVLVVVIAVLAICLAMAVAVVLAQRRKKAEDAAISPTGVAAGAPMSTPAAATLPLPTEEEAHHFPGTNLSSGNYTASGSTATPYQPLRRGESLSNPTYEDIPGEVSYSDVAGASGGRAMACGVPSAGGTVGAYLVPVAGESSSCCAEEYAEPSTPADYVHGTLSSAAPADYTYGDLEGKPLQLQLAPHRTTSYSSAIAPSTTLAVDAGDAGAAYEYQQSGTQSTRNSLDTQWSRPSTACEVAEKPGQEDNAVYATYAADGLADSGAAVAYVESGGEYERTDGAPDSHAVEPRRVFKDSLPHGAGTEEDYATMPPRSLESAVEAEAEPYMTIAPKVTYGGNSAPLAAPAPALFEEKTYRVSKTGELGIQSIRRQNPLLAQMAAEGAKGE